MENFIFCAVLVRFNTNNKRHFLTCMLTLVSNFIKNANNLLKFGTAKEF